jgi:hypothetical protein
LSGDPFFPALLQLKEMKIHIGLPFDNRNYGYASQVGRWKGSILGIKSKSFGSAAEIMRKLGRGIDLR